MSCWWNKQLTDWAKEAQMNTPSIKPCFLGEVARSLEHGECFVARDDWTVDQRLLRGANKWQTVSWSGWEWTSVGIERVVGWWQCGEWTHRTQQSALYQHPQTNNNNHQWQSRGKAFSPPKKWGLSENLLLAGRFSSKSTKSGAKKNNFEQRK